jgi:hypothetical protein
MWKCGPFTIESWTVCDYAERCAPPLQARTIHDGVESFDKTKISPPGRDERGHILGCFGIDRPSKAHIDDVKSNIGGWDYN